MFFIMIVLRYYLKLSFISDFGFGFAELAFGSVRIDFDNPQSKIRNPQF